MISPRDVAARKPGWTPAFVAIYSNLYNEGTHNDGGGPERIMEIETQALTTCEVAADGGAISLGFVDSSGRPATIRLSLNQVGALAMTLPGLIDKALQTRFGDASLRYAYPLASWMVEQSTDPTQGMVTLRTVDGFSVCFSIPREQQSELGEALVAQPASTATLRAN
jgi:hypothetical protein